jgi:hypothetical protein
MQQGFLAFKSPPPFNVLARIYKTKENFAREYLTNKIISDKTKKYKRD